MDTLGRRIEEMRRRRVMTQAELAIAAKVSLMTIGRLEADKIDSPRPNTVRGIAAALGVSPTWLVTGEENGLPS